jgi:hypothetical protein
MPSTVTALVSTHGSASYGELYREVFTVGPVLNTHGLGRKEVYICWESRVLVHGIKARLIKHCCVRHKHFSNHQ